MPGYPTAVGLERTELPGGTRVVTETVAGARSASIGIWVGVGGRDEPTELAGVSHFLEHLAFKGSDTRGAREVAFLGDRIGADLNAYTTKEYTVFYLRVPQTGASVGLDLLVDLVGSPAFVERDVDTERSVILEELAAYEDNPEDVADRLLGELVFPDHSLGIDVIGTEESVGAMTGANIRRFFEEWYRPVNLVIAGAGSIRHETVVDAAHALEARLGRSGSGSRPQRTPPGAAATIDRVERRDCEQAHLVLGWRAPGHSSPNRAAQDLFEHILGGGPASRLFQEVREQRALAYSVYAGSSLYEDVGALAVYAAVSPKRAPEALRVMSGLVEDLAANGVSDEELESARGYLAGSHWLGLEDNPAKMGRLGWWELSTGEVPPADAYPAQLGAVTAADVARVAAELLRGPGSLAAVGPFRQPLR